jgi:hypothetical protein
MEVEARNVHVLWPLRLPESVKDANDLALQFGVDLRAFKISTCSENFRFAQRIFGENSICFSGTYGAQGRDRTTDTVIFSHVLYQLSYLGADPADAGQGERRGL